jgi:hypothetical protein
MLILNDVLIDEDIFLQKFVCDISACKGECCVEGDAGAPLLKEELEDLEKNFHAAKEYLAEKNIKAVEDQGFGVIDDDGDLVTPLVDNAECAFVTYKDGIAMCSYERAFLDGKTAWRKPSSCYLYPIRIVQSGPFRCIKFHRWYICHAAFKNGNALGIPCYKFLKDPISQVFGEDFYNELCKVAEAFLSANRH